MVNIVVLQVNRSASKKAKKYYSIDLTSSFVTTKGTTYKEKE